jgi:hypothetical protein
VSLAGRKASGGAFDDGPLSDDKIVLMVDQAGHQHR